MGQIDPFEHIDVFPLEWYYFLADGIILVSASSSELLAAVKLP
jgi:hypothetical protein